MRRYDAPWIVLDSAAVRGKFNWQPRISLEQILSQIVDHHRAHLDWLDLANS
jgi:nucleoside-diphosphate-sugar epimerase